MWPGSWSPDGRVLAFTEVDPTTGWDIWVLEIEGDRSHLQQAAENLLFNARDATFEMRSHLREQARQAGAGEGPAADAVPPAKAQPHAAAGAPGDGTA